MAIGALLMRAVFIGAGVTLMERFHRIIYVFGAVLMVSGLKMAFGKDKEVHPEKNPVLKLFRRFMPVTTEYHAPVLREAAPSGLLNAAKASHQAEL